MLTSCENLDLLSVLIVTWNGDDLLSACLDSIFATCGESLEIVVVDNANLKSTRRIASSHPCVRYIAAKENLGFAGGNNLGLPHCTRKYVLLLNNDTLIHTADSFGQLVSYLEGHARVGAVQGKMVLPNRKGVLDECGSYLLDWGDLYFRHLCAPEETKVATGPVYHAKGAMLMFRRSILPAVGGFLFHEHFQSYCEDQDFCHRIWLAGSEVHYVDTPPISHLQGATAAKLKPCDRLAREFANRLFVYETLLDGYGWIKVGLKYRIVQRLIYWRFLLAGNKGETGWRKAGYALIRRERGLARKFITEVKDFRKVSDRDLFRIIYRKKCWRFHLAAIRGRIVEWGEP